MWVPSDGGGFVCPICGKKGRKGGRSGSGGRPKKRRSGSLSSQSGPPWRLASPRDPSGCSELLSSEAETLLGRWELGQGKRKCSPPKACSVMLRHRDSRVGLISRSGPGTGQSVGERTEAKAELRRRAEPGRPSTGWAAMGGGLTGIRGREGGRERQETEEPHVRHGTRSNGKYDRAGVKDSRAGGAQSRERLSNEQKA